jgi:DNA (cytosine-5)-methyltransferase 1
MHHHSPIIPYLSLCSGYEGIGLGLQRCIPNLRTVAYCEREAFAIANLVAKMENGLLDSAPIFADVRTFPWSSFTRLMAGGILSFGWPCQPVSVAGQRKAVDDERWLFDIIADGIAIMQPGMLFAENVEGLLTARMPDGSSVFGHCIERLESLHYRVTAGIFSASEVGAPHQRKRVFIMAVTSGLGGAPGFSGSFPRHEGQSGESDDSGGEAAWPSRPNERQHGWEPPRVVSFERSLGRDIDGSSGRMDYAELCVAGDNRTNELRLLGNGVVPATAELAYRTLAREFFTA